MNQQDALYETLSQQLNDLVRLYTHLSEVLAVEKNLLIECELKKIDECTYAKEQVLSKIQEIETQRVQTAAKLSKALTSRDESLRLLELAKLYHGEKAEQLKSAHAALDLLVNRVIEHNKENFYLAKSALDTVAGTMNAIRSSVAPSPTYKNKGVMNTNQTQERHLISREA